MKTVSPLGMEGNLYLPIWFESRSEVRKEKGSQLQMVLAVEEEAAPPVAGEQWGRAWEMEMGVRQGGMGHLCHKVHPSEPSTSFPGKRKAEYGHCCCYPLPQKPIMYMVLCRQSSHHWGFTCAGKCTLYTEDEWCFLLGSAEVEQH